MSLIVGVDELRRTIVDVCVVGSGPVGLSVALALAKRGVKVLLLESGFATPDGGKQRLSQADIVDCARHAEMKFAVTRAFGGTGWMWGGRCVPLDYVDFVPRASTESVGWPVSGAELEAFNTEAASLLGCGANQFVIKNSDAQFSNAEIDVTHVERWCEQPNVALSLGRRGFPANLTIALDSTVVDIEIANDQSCVRSLRIVSQGKDISFSRARVFILACGGLETTRLLLSAQQQHPNLFGGGSGHLGRNYMGHLSGKISRIRFRDPAAANLFAYKTDETGVYRRRIAFASTTLQRLELPNITFYPDNPRLGDPSHRSGLLSLLFLALSTPIVGRRLISEAIRQSQLDGRPRYSEHLRNVLLDAPNAARHIVDVLRQKFLLGRSKPFVFLETKSGEYPLHFHAEHRPQSCSRVTLSQGRDALGLKRLNIDLRFSDADADGVVRAHEVLADALGRENFAAIEFDDRREVLTERVLSTARDGFHQIGLARMGQDASDGVVDRNCKVFGLNNLFLAGSAVFRSSGQANPTFSSVALGIRLASHLADQLTSRNNANPQC